jgi:hypothetical protein
VSALLVNPQSKVPERILVGIARSDTTGGHDLGDGHCVWVSPALGLGEPGNRRDGIGFGVGVGA